MARDLITFSEFLQAVGKSAVNLSNEEAARMRWAITTASSIVRAYTDRDFTLAADAVQGIQTYEYRGNGLLDIDDAEAVTQVAIAPTTFSAGRTLQNFEWFAEPQEATILTYIKFFTSFVSRGISPEMGFEYNLDKYPYIPYPVLIQVTAVWGWPAIPPDVKQATVWGAEAFVHDPTYQAESISGYSRSYPAAGSRSFLPGAAIQALPDRAIALLDNYTRWPV